MYVVSSVDPQDFPMAEPLDNSFYVYITCVTCVYDSKQDYIDDPLSYKGMLRTKVRSLIQVVDTLRYIDSPLFTPYTTVIAEFRINWDEVLPYELDDLKRRMRACHDRYLNFFKHMTDKEDELLSVQETFGNIRRSMQRFELI